jgi:hypothetical protein
MPSAPKGRGVPTFAFDDMSDSEEEIPEIKPVKNFGFDLDSEEE